MTISKPSKSIKNKRTRYPIWHPYTQMNEWKKESRTIITKGEGFYLVDQKGRRYLDGIASMWCNVWGHGKNEIIKDMIKQLHKVQHSSLFGLSNETSIKLAKELVKIAKGMHHVFFSDNGSTAIEVAMKMALQYWRNKGDYRKVRFISMENGYHGDTIGAMSIGYISKYFSPYLPLINSAIRILPPPSAYLCNNSDSSRYQPNTLEQYYVNKVEETLRKYQNECCALVMESGAQIAGGVRIYPKQYQRKIANLCNNYGVLFILDEIATGFGRLGSMVEYLSQRSIPDIVCFGKSLTAGYSPLAVTLTTDNIFTEFLGEYSQNKQLYHGHTYTGHTLGCSAALANIKLYQKYNLIDQIGSNSVILRKRLQEIENEFSIAIQSRSKGLLGAIDLVYNGNNRHGEPIEILKDKSTINKFIMQESLRMGVFLRSLGNTIIVIPPLAINESDLQLLLDAIYELIRKIESLL